MAQAGGVRRPAVAGSFYPDVPHRLAAVVDRLLADAAVAVSATDGVAVRGVVSPHAGYVYSGPIAATAYAALSRGAPDPSRIVVAGLSHFEPLRGLAVSAARAWRTPLGDAVVDEAGRHAVVAAGAEVDEAVHRSEHSIEVQLPFIQRCFPDVPVLPVAVGAGPPETSAAILGEVVSDDALLVVSTDLSHYRDAETARRQDARTAEAVEALDHEALDTADACGVDPLRVGIAWARGQGHGIRLLDLRNSADTAGGPERVVGYAAFAITAEAA